MADDWQPIDDWTPVDTKYPNTAVHQNTLLDEIQQSFPGRYLTGTGMELHNIYTGLKGLVTDLTPQEIQDAKDRQTYIRNNPASAGLGALGPNVASFALPGGAEARGVEALAQSAPGLASRFASLPTAAQVGARTLGRTASDAALSAAYSPTDRGTNAGLGALGSLTGQALAGGGRALYSGVQNMLPENRAGAALLGAAERGQGIPGTVSSLQQNVSPVPGLDFSAAQATQDPAIAQLERGSRINPVTAPDWANFDTGQNTAAFNQLGNVVNHATDDALEAAAKQRANLTNAMRTQALAAAGQNDFSTPIRTQASGILSGPEQANTEAGRMAQYVLKNVGPYPSRWVGLGLAEPGDFPNPEQAYNVRKTLADALNAKMGAPLSPEGASAKVAFTQSVAMKKTIDDAIDKAAGGTDTQPGPWKQYLAAFKAASPDVNNLQALNNMRDDLQAKMLGGATDLAGNPKITRAFVGNIINKYGTNKYGDTLLPNTRIALESLQDTLQSMEAPQANYRGAITAGGGSNTPADLAMAAAPHMAGALGLGTPLRLALALKSAVSNAGAQGGATRLAGLLQSQQQAAQAIQRAAALRAAQQAPSSAAQYGGNIAAALTPSVYGGQ